MALQVTLFFFPLTFVLIGSFSLKINIYFLTLQENKSLFVHMEHLDFFRDACLLVCRYLANEFTCLIKAYINPNTPLLDNTTKYPMAGYIFIY